MNGFLSTIKPPGMTSYDVIRFIKTGLKGVKIGHAGTLDPGASGVLPLCLGKATKAAPYIMESKKKYRGEVTLGISTETQDGEGRVITRSSVDCPSPEHIKQVLSSLKGEISQKLPIYSAKKHQGKPLYEWARKGHELSPSYKNVTIYHLELIELFEEQFPRLIIDIECSRGTYIRALASQIGEMLVGSGHLSFLLREAVGFFTLDVSVTLEDLQQELCWDDFLLPIDYALKDYCAVTIKNEAVKYLRHGNWLVPAQVEEKHNNQPSQVCRLYDSENNFWGLVKWEKTNVGLKLKPMKLFRT